MPLVSVVFPLPRSPVSNTRMGGWRRFANSLPHCVVSSAECVMISSFTRLQLLQELMARTGNGGSYFSGEQAGLISIFYNEFGGFTMQVDAECEDSRPVGGFELRGKGRENSRQDIPGAPFCQAGVAGRVEEDLTVGGSDDGVRAFEDDVSVPAARGILRRLDAILLH